MAIALRRVANSFKELQKDPVEGIMAELPDDSDMFLWHIWMEGPPGSPYEGAIFLLKLEFPDDFPMSPPKLSFLSEFWHPNVYRNGEVCISILHPPGEDEMSGELAAERWLPTHTIASIMLSVISMLNDPNLSSPANVEASVMWRDRRAEFIERCNGLVALAKTRTPSHVKIPHPETNESERKRAMLKNSRLNDDDLLVESDPEDHQPSTAAIEDDLDDSPDEHEPKPPRKTKDASADKKKQDTKSTGKSKSSGDGKKTHKDKPKNETSTPTPGDPDTDDKATPQDTSTSKRHKTEPKREPVVEEASDSASPSEESSSMDPLELENLTRPDAEFTQWKRQWLPLPILRATNKGWSKSRGSSTANKDNPSRLAILTYNVLRHSTAEGSTRAIEQCNLLQDANVQVLVLNDVTPAFHKQLAEQAWTQGYYAAYGLDAVSDNSDSTMLVGKASSSLVLSRNRILQAQYLVLPSRSEKGLLRVEIETGAGISLALVAAHLDDSIRDLKLRVQQLVQVNKALEGFVHDPAHVEVFAGDFGLCPTTKEHKVIDKSFTDAWVSRYSRDAGLTYDPAANKMTKVINSNAQPSRRDRILFRASGGVALSTGEVQLLGTTKLAAKYKGTHLWPSDHFALQAEFSLRADRTCATKKPSKCVLM